jgi:uncharacterized protein involved in cysteine biosynthesis
MTDQKDTTRPLPGRIRRVAAGAWHVPAGIAYLLRRPRLWPGALLPIAIAGSLIFVGAILGWLAAPVVEEATLSAAGPQWLTVVSRIAIWVGTPLAGMIAGYAIALLLAAPLLEWISRRVEIVERGEAAEADNGLTWDLLQSLRGALFFLLAAPGIFLLGLIPLIGPPLAMLWGAHALAFQQTDSPLARRGLSFAHRRRWHRHWRPESLGFGLAGLTTLFIPLANLLVAPALAVGATRLVLELDAESQLQNTDLSEPQEAEEGDAAPPPTPA